MTLVWAFTVGATGMINTWADLIIKYWQYDQLSTLLAPYQGQPPVPMAERGPVQQALEAALARAPGMKTAFIAFPGTSFSSPHHNTVFLRGQEPLTARPAGAGGCQDRRDHRQPRPALVPDGAAGVAAAALWRLRRQCEGDAG